MDAFVTIRYRLSNICDERDLVDTGMTFDGMVRFLITENSVWGLAEAADGEIVLIEHASDVSSPELPQ